MTRHPYTKKVGNKVRVTRKEKGITVRKLGAMCGIDYANLSRFENGYQDILLLMLKEIADALNVNVKDLL